jgi:tRNA nucleotidyltransferase (CCA-adding enzyme)
MEIITSHTNADFDALASMVAAKKLYPSAKLVFAGSQEKSMRDFFLESTAYSIETERLRNVDVDKITRLIIVDNRNPNRLGKLAGALGRPGVSVHIYDHHPRTGGEIKGEQELIEEVGATTTLMVELLQQKGIAITPFEATVFALGIYEETGALTYLSTTARDARAAAYLISQGANLNVVADFIVRDLTPEQVAVLNELAAAAKSYDINGVTVVVAAIATPHFVPDLAALAHRMRDRDGLDVLFLVVQMGDKTHVIGRSRLPQVNAGKVLESLGGGGHLTAASAVARDLTYLETRERLIDILKRHIVPGRSASDIMTSPVKTVPTCTSIEQANEAMTRFSVNVLPVLDGTRFLGIITREVVQKALFHGLGNRTVDEFMSTGVPVAVPDMPMARVEQVMIGERQRFMPVIAEDGMLVGAITRTDLLRSLHEQRFGAAGLPPEPGMQPVRNVRGMLEERVPSAVRETLKAVGEIADESGFPVYLVGGIVRDLFLRVENLDVDIVVEGDGIVFAGMIVRKLGGRMRTHQKFGTAVVVLPGGVKLDIATARLEYYETPAALPTVELSSIKKDLYRRDFTINTLAVRLNRDRYGELIDFFGGLRDIKERTIRILHNLSFVEDPTRVFRAIRFEQRFDFPIGKHTRNLIRSAVNLKLFNKLSGERIYDELVLMFSELDPLKVLRRMEELDLLKFLHPNLRFGTELERLFSGIGETLTWYRLLYLEVPVERWFVYFLGLLDRLKDDAAQEALVRLAVPPRVRKRVMASRLNCRDILFEFYRSAQLPASRIYDLLHPLDIEQVLVMMAKARKEPAKRYISLYLTRLRDVRVALTGDDLKRMGLPPGPRYKKILAGLLNAKLDGTVATKEDEVAYVKRLIGRR